MVYPTEFPSIDHLIAKPKAPVLLVNKGFPIILTFNTNDPISGACKVAYFGHTNKPVFPGSESLAVCVKQAFCNSRTSDSRIIFEGPKQAELLTTEINCSRWASALMHLVYEFMERENQTRGKPPFPVPKTRYVNVALAVASNNKRDAYLLEEVVDGSDRDFLKYINNTSAAPLPQPDAKREHVGLFLSFAQHVQMLETQRHVFVSDQQGIQYCFVAKNHVDIQLLTGGLTLLSDPQIITSP
jgi:hypothetical protein